MLVACVLQACGEIPRIPVRAGVNGQEIFTTVDSEIAAYYIADYLSGRRSRPELDSIINAVHSHSGSGLPARNLLRNLTREHSTDFAALVLWRMLSAKPRNQVAATLFAKELEGIGRHAETGSLCEDLIPRDYLILFAPGWFYRSQPENGADFARPRAVLDAAGARTLLLETDENGSIERNADEIAKTVLNVSRIERKIILVSASKAGPEVALALSTLRQSGSLHGVKAWVNIGGVLRGSALADEALRWPVRWYVKLFVIGGRTFEGIEGLNTASSAKRADTIRLPREILVMNYVGIPLSGQVSDRARLGYSLMRNEGPNDGLTQIIDEIPSGSITIAELGLDHFFGHPQIHVRTVALARTVIRYLETQRGSAAQPGAAADAAEAARPSLVR